MYTLKKLQTQITNRAREAWPPRPESYHANVVQFWLKVVVGTCTALMIVVVLSLSMWWVAPADVVVDEVFLPEEVPESLDGAYDNQRAEKVIQFYQERKKNTGKFE